LIGAYVSATVQLPPGAIGAPQVVVERKGHWLVTRRTVNSVELAALVSVSVCFADCPDGTCPKLNNSPGWSGPLTPSIAAPVPYPLRYPNPLTGAPALGVPCAVTVPVMLPFIIGRKLAEKLQLPFAATLVHGAPASTNCLGSATFNVIAELVRLLIVNCRVAPSDPVTCGPKSATFGTISMPLFCAVYVPFSGTVWSSDTVLPPGVIAVTGIVSTPETGPLAGANVTVTVHEALGASAAQLLDALKLGAPPPFIVALTGLICSTCALVFVTVTTCCVAVVPGTLLKVRVVGFNAMPGSLSPYPVKAVVVVVAPARTVRVPVLAPVAVGANAIAISQDAVYVSGPPQGAEPVAVFVIANSPVIEGAFRVIVPPPATRFVTANTCAPLTLLIGTNPKSAIAGVSNNPLCARPVPVSEIV